MNASAAFEVVALPTHSAPVSLWRERFVALPPDEGVLDFMTMSEECWRGSRRMKPGNELAVAVLRLETNPARARATALEQEILAGQSVRRVRHRMGMDITWLTGRIAVGGGIWNADNMAAVARAGITHIIDMQIEFDDTPLADGHGVTVCWNPIDDDFEPKPAEVFERGVGFALEALDGPDAKVFIHCAAGVHRAPMMALALLGVMGWHIEEAMDLIEGRRPVADFADVYVRSVEEFLKGRAAGVRRSAF